MSIRGFWLLQIARVVSTLLFTAMKWNFQPPDALSGLLMHPGCICSHSGLHSISYWKDYSAPPDLSSWCRENGLTAPLQVPFPHCQLLATDFGPSGSRSTSCD